MHLSLEPEEKVSRSYSGVDNSTMSSISDRIKELSIFRSFFSQDEVTMAINGRSQLIVASSNVVKTTLVTDKHNSYKVLQSSTNEFNVVDVSFNESGNLLALIGLRSVTICDTRSLPRFDGQSSHWEPFNFQIGPFDSDIKSVLWHPVNRLGSELVILTETEILLYDAVISFSSPMLILKLVDYEQLKGQKVESISFGSKDNFAGSITLYLTTSQGKVFAIYPFVYEGSKITAKKSLVVLFIRESIEALDAVQNSFPPVALENDAHVLALRQHCSFAQDLEYQLRRPSNSALESDDIITLTHRGEDFGHVLQGPLAVIGPIPEIIQIRSGEDVAVMAAVHSEKSKAVFTHLAQLQPLIMGWKNPQQLLNPPVEPIKSEKRKEEKYSKPRRGFGYIVDSGSESEDEDVEYLESLVDYKEDMEIYKIKTELQTYFKTNFNKLSVLAVDETSMNHDLSRRMYFRNVDGEKLICGRDGQVLLVDVLDAIKLIFTDDRQYEPKYKMTHASSKANCFAYFNDTLEGLGEYAIAFSPGSPVDVILFEAPADKVSSVVLDAELPLKFSEETFESGFLTTEMSSILESVPTKPIHKVSSFNPEDTTSMSQILEVTDTVAERTSELLKFMLALQLKVRTQLEVLRIQVDDLNHINESSESSDDFTKNSTKIEELTERQAKLLEKAKRIKSSVSERFENMKLSLNLPLSAAEKDWFREINHLNKVVNIGDKNDKCLIELIKSLKLEVLEFSNNMKKESTTSNKLTNTIEHFSLSNELVRLRQFLISESKQIESIKKQAEMCNIKIEQVGSL